MLRLLDFFVRCLIDGEFGNCWREYVNCAVDAPVAAYVRLRTTTYRRIVTIIEKCIRLVSHEGFGTRVERYFSDPSERRKPSLR